VLAASLETADPAFGAPRAGCTYRKRRAGHRLHTGSSRRSRRSALGPCFYLFDGIDHPLRIKITSSSTTAYYELDLAGNVRGLRASGGASLGDYRYSAFGQTLEDTTSITQPLRWKARWFSPVAGGTYDVRARQWSPELGVFLSVDEYEFQDPSTTLWGWPGQNPQAFKDPLGRGGAPSPSPSPPGHDIGCGGKSDSVSACKCACQDAFEHKLQECREVWGGGGGADHPKELANCKADGRSAKATCECNCDPKACNSVACK